jgi:4-diphosphocytidyl-2-C-methyl-D-erythritol kinase
VLYRCYAKVNLTLEIVGRRADGYHDLLSLVHTISLGDDLRIEPAEAVVSRVEGLAIDPDTNLVVRAARLLAASLGTTQGAELTLVKRTPAAAGLGGGSSDAAATLVGLNRLWGTRLGYAAVARLAAQLGSDVPFFLRGGAALMAGRGDQLEALPPLERQWLVLLVPAHTIGDKTARLYAALEPADFTSGAATRRAASRLLAGQALDPAELPNGFGRAAQATFPGLGELWEAAEQRCGRRFLLSGAGPTLFALAQDRAEATALQRRLAALGAATFTAHTVRHARAGVGSRYAGPPRIRYP